VELLAEGLPQKAVAHRLGIAHRTVEDHVARACRRVGVGSCAELVHAWKDYLATERNVD
jgi:DNA-binding CsgD family transcriptional regulator